MIISSTTVELYNKERYSTPFILELLISNYRLSGVGKVFIGTGFNLWNLGGNRENLFSNS